MRLLRVRWNGLKVRGNSTEGQEARRFRGHGQHRQVTRCEREMQTCSNQCQPAEFWANLHNRGGFCTGRSDVQDITQRQGKKPRPSPYPKIPPTETDFLMRISYHI